MGLLIGDVVRHAAQVTPDGLAATLGEREITFAELDEESDFLAAALRWTGVRHRMRVGCLWPAAEIRAVFTFAALAKLGAMHIPLNAALGPDELRPILEVAKPDVLVGYDAAPETPPGVTVPIRLDAAALEPAPRDREDKDPVDEPRLVETDPHIAFFTSGSTGRPKGVVLSHRVSHLRSFPSLGVAVDGGTVNMFPLFHMAAWSLVLGAWQARRAIHFVETPDAPSLLGTAARRRAARIYAIPAVWGRILRHGVAPYDLSALHEADTGTSATPPELIRQIREALPHTVTRVFYGSTEAGPGTILAHADLERKPGSVGLPQPGVFLRLTDEGEVCLRGELLMDGYLDDPDATAAAIDADGWYHTGDLGVLDDEGYLSIVGRRGQVLRTGGETVAPVEVETVLADHPAVGDVAVVGIPDPQWGEVVCAVVVPAADVPVVSLDDLRAHCAGRLAGFKHPRRLELVDALPRTAATGQVQRTLLLERITSRAE